MSQMWAKYVLAAAFRLRCLPDRVLGVGCAAFARSKYVSQHYRALHDKERHLCLHQGCNETFTRKHDLDRHLNKPNIHPRTE